FLVHYLSLFLVFILGGHKSVPLLLQRAAEICLLFFHLLEKLFTRLRLRYRRLEIKKTNLQRTGSKGVHRKGQGNAGRHQDTSTKSLHFFRLLKRMLLQKTETQKACRTHVCQGRTQPRFEAVRTANSIGYPDQRLP